MLLRDLQMRPPAGPAPPVNYREEFLWQMLRHLAVGDVKATRMRAYAREALYRWKRWRWQEESLGQGDR
jgi:hypothetical protein